MVRLSTFPRFLHNVKFPLSEHPRSTWLCRLWQAGRLAGCRCQDARLDRPANSPPPPSARHACTHQASLHARPHNLRGESQPQTQSNHETCHHDGKNLKHETKTGNTALRSLRVGCATKNAGVSNWSGSPCWFLPLCSPCLSSPFGTPVVQKPQRQPFGASTHDPQIGPLHRKPPGCPR